MTTKTEKLEEAYSRMINMYQHEVRGREDDNSTVESELRKLMDSYWSRSNKLHEEKKEAKENEETDAELTAEALEQQCLKMIAELFYTMKAIGVLDLDEINFGSVRRVK